MNKKTYISPQIATIKIKAGCVLSGSDTVNNTLPEDGNTSVMSKDNSGSFSIWGDEED